MRQYRITYSFSHSKFGFQNSITVSEKDEIKALLKAKEDVINTYRIADKDLKRWQFKEPVQLA